MVLLLQEKVSHGELGFCREGIFAFLFLLGMEPLTHVAGMVFSLPMSYSPSPFSKTLFVCSLGCTLDQAGHKVRDPPSSAF